MFSARTPGKNGRTMKRIIKSYMTQKHDVSSANDKIEKSPQVNEGLLNS